MRFSFLAGGLPLAALVAASAWAADAPRPRQDGSAQEAVRRQKAENCAANADARGLQGEARDGFMGQCLQGGIAGSAMKAAPTEEQTCMTQADDKKLAGPARGSFIQGCLGR
jgi:hypothetical protein